jgi:hypothetical protein
MKYSIMFSMVGFKVMVNGMEGHRGWAWYGMIRNGGSFVFKK